MTTTAAPTTSRAAVPFAATVPFRARGPLSERVIAALAEEGPCRDVVDVAVHAVGSSTDILQDDDVQLALFALYASAYGSIEAFDAAREWDPDLLRARAVLEGALEERLRAVVPQPERPAPRRDDVADALFALTAEDGGPSLARFLAKKATQEQAREFLVQRSIYTLREADPHSWAIPRLSGSAKAALVEIQSDEYGGGRPDRVHATLFARAMRGAGLSDAYGAYVDRVPAITLASLNTMSLFGLNRRLVGAVVGHLAAFEMTSSIPNRFYAEGLRRVGFGDDVAEYFDEHVEADAVHEQIAGRDLAGSLAEERPELLDDILFGASACLVVDGLAGAAMLNAWRDGRTSLRGQEAA
ncbi:iron-containing redox enzyme family protein [Microbacterium gilvum]|uniref:Iron-containing redox enzyme family protein n=1 Tax=Microbacterium gilvum TaxID=1336204 RepID=A0ABP9A8M6_9MICO